ncbi:MAG: hypothetical protein NTY77_01955 [Elusimicrobia bacterium]|nr:hypothetical protein [Elusimicrobiota bacterium]
MFACIAGLSTAGRLHAAGLESLAAGAGRDFARSLAADKPLSIAPAALAQRRQAVMAAADEFKRLAAAFAKGTAPKKEELAGWRAGRIFDQSFPDDPGSVLLAGADKLVALVLYAGPTFYENLDADLAAGVAIFIKDDEKNWTAPQFGPAGAAFERILPEYEKGFSRYEARKAADNTLLLKHVWRSELGGSVSGGTEYAFFTKNVTP